MAFTVACGKIPGHVSWCRNSEQPTETYPMNITLGEFPNAPTSPSEVKIKTE
jgi:hypothetical protein